MDEILDSRRPGWRQITIALLCLLVLAIDGLDYQMLAYVAPMVIDDFGISKTAARLKFTYRYQTRELDEQLLRHRKDHVFKSTCTFFDQDQRRCTVYEARPSVCRIYPEDRTCGYYEFLKFERIQQGDEDFIPSA